jgi:hypothetical protein
MQVNIKKELKNLDRNDFTRVCDLADKIVFDLGDILTEAGDECMLDAAKDYIIDLINPSLLDMENNQ